MEVVLCLLELNKRKSNENEREYVPGIRFLASIINKILKNLSTTSIDIFNFQEACSFLKHSHSLPVDLRSTGIIGLLGLYDKKKSKDIRYQPMYN